MNTRARNRYLLAWLPRGALIVTALLAPVIDRGEEPVAGSGVHEATEQVEPARTVLEDAGARES